MKKHIKKCNIQSFNTNICSEERSAFFCDRPLPLLNAINFVFHNMEYSYENTDIFILNEFTGADDMADRLRSEKIFSHVFFLQKNMLRKHNGKIGHGVAALLYILHLRDPLCSFLREEADKYIWNVDKSSIDWHYDNVFTSSFGVFLWKKLVHALRGRCSVFFYDDGCASYCSYYPDTIHHKPKSLDEHIRKIFKYGKYDMRIEGLFLNNPAMCQYDSSMIFPLPPINMQETRFVDVIKTIFHYHASPVRCIFLEQNLVEKMQVDVEALRQNIFRRIVRRIPREDFMVRLHPVQRTSTVAEQLNIQIDPGDTMWELNCVFGGISDRNILIGFSSTALLTPKMLFDNEPIVICLYRLLQWSDQNHLRETENFFLDIRAHYADTNRFIIVDDLEQLDMILQRIQPEYLCNK